MGNIKPDIESLIHGHTIPLEGGWGAKLIMYASLLVQGGHYQYSLSPRFTMAPKVRRLAIMGQPSVAQLQRGAVYGRESKLRKDLEKEEAKGWIIIKKNMKKKKMKEEKKKKKDKKKEVH